MYCFIMIYKIVCRLKGILFCKYFIINVIQGWGVGDSVLILLKINNAVPVGTGPGRSEVPLQGSEQCSGG